MPYLSQRAKGMLALLLLFATIGVFQRANAAQTLNVTVSNFTYTPNIVRINQGDTVTWSNNNGGQHNVAADDGTFNSGAVSTSFTYSHTFTTPGIYRYFCVAHGGAGGIGMSGQVVVLGTEKINLPFVARPAS
jgi:plastocyanin